MKTDRKLLELAAKAAGINVYRADDTLLLRGGTAWNPLTDDGDALRLAMEVDITIDAPEGGGYVYAGGQGSFSEPVANDKMAAIRRAIVRAAAETGRTMP